MQAPDAEALVVASALDVAPTIATIGAVAADSLAESVAGLSEAVADALAVDDFEAVAFGGYVAVAAA